MLIELAALLYISSFDVDAAVRFSPRLLIVLLIVFGLWVQSNVVRYLGAVWLAFVGVAAGWQFYQGGGGPVAVLAQIVGVPCIVASAISVFSKTFSDEFACARQNQPRSKSALKRIVFGVLIAAAVAAAMNDIYRLALKFHS